MRFVRCALGIVAMAAMLLVPAPAGASMSGPCSVATVGGYNIAAGDGPIVVTGDQQSLAYHFEAAQPVVSYSVVLNYGPFDVNIGQGAGNGQTVDNAFDLTSFRSLGTGLYQVQAHVLLQSGATCDGSFLVRIEGNPFGTALGLTALVLALAGIGAVLGVTIQTVHAINVLFVDPRLK